MKEKLIYLEGLRGLAALVVVFRHLQLTIAPDAFDRLKLALDDVSGSSTFTHLVLGVVHVFFNAELAVYLFWFLSAYAISYRLFVVEDPGYVTEAFSKRYLRLAIPVLTSIVFAFVLMSLGAMHNQSLASLTGNDWLAGHYDFDTDLYSALKMALWGIFFRDENPIYNPVLWTIFPEFIGSLFCFTLFGIFRDQRGLVVISLAAAIVALLLHKYWLVTFMLGFSWCTIRYSKHFHQLRLGVDSIFKFSNLNVIAGYVILIGSGVYDFYFGGLYGHYWLFHIASSASIIIIVIQTELFRQLLSCRPCVWLGRISFGLYVMHFPVLCSFTCWFFLKLDTGGLIGLLITSVLSISLCLFVATVFTRYVDALSKSLANQFGKLISGRNHNN